MKTYKEVISEVASIKMKPAKNDQEIFDRIEKLKKAGIDAQSSAESKTHILVNTRDLKRAKKILGLKENINEAKPNFGDDLVVYPENVKFGKDGKVSSYKLKIVYESDSGEKVIKDKSLEKYIISQIGEEDLKSSIAVSPKAAVFNIEVEQDNKGYYIQIGRSKQYFKM